MLPTNQEVGGLIPICYSAPMDPWENADFWKAVTTKKPPLLYTAEGVFGADNTAALWRQHYTTLYNNGPKSVLTPEVYEAIHKVFDSKACGLDHITAEHLRHASLRLAPVSVLYFTGFVIHDIPPHSVLCILLVPVIKVKAGKGELSGSF